MKAIREKWQLAKEFKVISWFFRGNCAVQGKWEGIFEVMKGNYPQPRRFYPAGLSFRFDREIKKKKKKLHKWANLREFDTTRSVLKQKLKEWRERHSSVQSLSRVWLFATPWITACQASLSITNSQSLLKLMPIESVNPFSHLILCRPLLLLPPIPPSIRVFSNETTLHEVAKVLEFQLQHQSFQWTPKTDLL